MATTATTPPGEPAPVESESKPVVNGTLGDNGIKALQSERERAQTLEKALNAATAELDTIRQAQLSDLEKAQAAATTAQAAADSAKAEALRYRIAARNGIDDTDAELFLTGTDEATMTKQAARLLERTPATPGVPRPDPSQGASTDALALSGNPLLDTVKQKLGIT